MTTDAKCSSEEVFVKKGAYFEDPDVLVPPRRPYHRRVNPEGFP
jgi:hypothetical protein